MAERIIFKADGALTCDLVDNKVKCFDLNDPVNKEDVQPNALVGEYLEIWPSAVNIDLDTKRKYQDDGGEQILMANGTGRFDIGVVKGTTCILDESTIDCHLE